MDDGAAHGQTQRTEGLSLLENQGGTSFVLSDLLHQAASEVKSVDIWQGLLVELVHLLATFFNSTRLSGFETKHEADINAISEVLCHLAKIPNVEGGIQIRFRGRGSGPADSQNEEKFDYVIHAGPLLVDLPLVKALSKRHGIITFHLPGRLRRAFEFLALLDISTLHISTGNGRPELMGNIQTCLQYLAWFFASVLSNSFKSNRLGAANGRPEIVLNEHGQADPNLTTLAALNNLKKDSVQKLVHKVVRMLASPGDASGLKNSASVYDAIFNIKKFHDLLIKPAVEINNARWLMVNDSEELVSKGSARFSTVVSTLFSAEPNKAAQIMGSMFDGNYQNLSASELKSNLHNFSLLLEKIKGNGLGKSAATETEGMIRQLLEQVPEKLFDSLTVQGNRVQGKTAQEEILSEILQPEITDMVSYFKRRSGVKRKMRQMLREDVAFDAQEMEVIAKDFGVSQAASEHLIRLVRECFGKDGRFYRKIFEKNISAFLKYEKKVFEFLWHFFKEIVSRDDRVAFLNSLQLLISRMKKPEISLAVLLRDFTVFCRDVRYSDRNALVLANILLRKYNKEMQNHIEITPEEVLLVWDGLNQDMIRSASAFIAENQEKLFQKIRTIHQELQKIMQTGLGSSGAMSPKYLLSLEREMYILLSLVGSLASHKILRSVVKEYGDPNSLVYVAAKPEQLKAIFQLLQVTVRGLGRFLDRNDIRLLQEIRLREEGFIALNPAIMTAEFVKRVMIYVDQAVHVIMVS